jgi:hypothetical protein
LNLNHGKYLVKSQAFRFALIKPQDIRKKYTYKHLGPVGISKIGVLKQLLTIARVNVTL